MPIVVAKNKKRRSLHNDKVIVVVVMVINVVADCVPLQSNSPHIPHAEEKKNLWITPFFMEIVTYFALTKIIVLLR